MVFRSCKAKALGGANELCGKDALLDHWAKALEHQPDLRFGIRAGTFGPNDLDATFGPQVMYSKAPTAEQGANLPPSMGLQFFGLADIDGETQQMTVRLMDRADNELFSVTLDPEGMSL